MEKIINPNLERAQVLLEGVGFEITWCKPAVVVAGHEMEPEGDPVKLVMLYDGTLINKEGHLVDYGQSIGEKRAIPEVLIAERETYIDLEGNEWGILFTAQNYEEALERGWYPRFPVILKDFSRQVCERNMVQIPYYSLHPGNEIEYLYFCPGRYKEE